MSLDKARGICNYRGMKNTIRKTRTEIARENGAYPATVTRLIKGERKTYNIPLAIEVARLTGKKPVEFISENIIDIALQLNPGLAKRKRVMPELLIKKQKA